MRRCEDFPCCGHYDESDKSNTWCPDENGVFPPVVITRDAWEDRDDDQREYEEEWEGREQNEEWYGLQELLEASRRLERHLPFEGQVGEQIRITPNLEAAAKRFRDALGALE